MRINLLLQQHGHIDQIRLALGEAEGCRSWMSTKFGSQQKQSPQDNTGGGRTHTDTTMYRANPNPNRRVNTHVRILGGGCSARLNRCKRTSSCNNTDTVIGSRFRRKLCR